MLPSSVTLNVGTPATDITYSDAVQLSGSAMLFYAPSPQSDLQGRPSLRISHETTKKGIARSLGQFITPVYDSVAKTYKGFIKTDIVITRDITVSVADVEKEIEKLQELPILFRQALARASI